MKYLISAICLLVSINLYAITDSTSTQNADTLNFIADSLQTQLDSLIVDSAEIADFEFHNELKYSQWRYKFKDSIKCQQVDTVYVDTLKKADYIKRLSKLPVVIEMPYNKVVKTYIDLYANKHHDRLARLLGLSNYYFPFLEDVLAANNMPVELKYLPVIESALNPTAYSRVGAAGLWQFMPSTGRLYGLKNTSLVDDRRDPIKSTYAAVKFLKDLHAIYGDWLLVIAAYNCGPGNVNKAMRRSGGKDYWAIYDYLPRETRGYVPAFIAVNYAMYYAKDLNVCPAETAFPSFTDTIMVNFRVHFEQIAAKMNVSVDELRLLNPQYKFDIVPGDLKSSSLCLPENNAYLFLDIQDSILAYKPELISKRYETKTASINGSSLVHRVRNGENLSVIAQRYRVSVRNLKSWNGLRSDRLKIGQRLYIRPSAKYKKANKSTKPRKILPLPKSGKYRIKDGESLWVIARKFDITVQSIRNANAPADLSVIKPGQTIKLPKK